MSYPQRWTALAVLSAAGLMTILDGSIVTVAMPAIQQDLGFTPAGLSWMVNAYLIPFGGLLLLAGRLGDLIGRRVMFLAGTVVFTAASLLAGLADGPGTLIAARFLQGAGSAMATAVVLGILVTLFTEPAERAKAIAIFSFTGAAGASIGQVLGGVLTDTLSWPWIFFINVPIGIATVALALRALPRDRGAGLSAGADVIGAALVTAGLMLGIYTIVTESHTLALGAVSILLLALFLVRQATAANPLMPLRVLRSRSVAGANLAQMLTVAGMFAFQVMVALHMQNVLGYTALQTGLAMLPAAVSIGAVSLFVSAPLSNRLGARTVLIAGLALLVAAMVLLSRIPERADYVTDLLPAMLLISGGGLVLPALASLGMSGAKESDAGLASGLFTTTQQVGMAIGVAVLSALAASRTSVLVTAGQSEAAALTGGYRLAFTVSAGLLLAAFLVGLVVLRQPAGATGAGPATPTGSARSTAAAAQSPESPRPATTA